MPLEISCPSCSAKFRVPDSAAGKKIRCPKCKGAIDVPATEPVDAPAVAQSLPARAAAPAPLPIRPAAQPDQWHLKTEGGECYGPVTRNELDGWKAEGRITSECQLLVEGREQWQWAGDVYADLDGQPPTAASRPASVDRPSPSPTNKNTSAKKSPPNKEPIARPADDDEPGRSSRSKAIAGLLGIFLGPLGTHRFYLGYWGLGLAMLFTLGGCGIWSLVDAALVLLGRVTDADGRPLSD
jgi:predicted Zn finger-like uncharacterized protein